MTQRERDQLTAEIKVLEKLQHPNIVKCAARIVGLLPAVADSPSGIQTAIICQKRKNCTCIWSTAAMVTSVDTSSA